MIQKSANVTVQHPIHLLPCDCDVQRIQRLMLASSWSETIRIAPKILLVYLIEDRDHGLLNDLVLQCRDDQRELHLSPVPLWDGLKSVTLSIRCAASASKCSKKGV
jgi:hypothetical protein